MFAKTTFALALVLATASGALAAAKQQSVELRNSVYDGAARISAPIRTPMFDSSCGGTRVAVTDPS
jgi:hypothetical protein